MINVFSHFSFKNNKHIMGTSPPPPTQANHDSVCHYLREKGASNKLLILKEGNALAAV